MDIRIVEAELNETLREMACLYDGDCMGSPFYLCETALNITAEENNTNTTSTETSTDTTETGTEIEIETESSGSGEFVVEDSFYDMEDYDSLPKPEGPVDDDTAVQKPPLGPPWFSDDEDLALPSDDYGGSKDGGNEVDPNDKDAEKENDDEYSDKPDFEEEEEGLEKPELSFLTGGTTTLQCRSLDVILVFACLLLVLV